MMTFFGHFHLSGMAFIAEAVLEGRRRQDKSILKYALKFLPIDSIDTPRDKSTGILGSTKPLNEEVLASSRPEVGFSPSVNFPSAPR
jgi:hypothetical protein